MVPGGDLMPAPPEASAVRPGLLFSGGEAETLSAEAAVPAGVSLLDEHAVDGAPAAGGLVVQQHDEPVVAVDVDDLHAQAPGAPYQLPERLLGLGSVVLVLFGGVDAEQPDGNLGVDGVGVADYPEGVSVGDGGDPDGDGPAGGVVGVMWWGLVGGHGGVLGVKVWSVSWEQSYQNHAGTRMLFSVYLD